MKKMMIVTAIVLLSAACARVDSDRNRNQNLNAFGVAQPQQFNPQQIQTNPNHVIQQNQVPGQNIQMQKGVGLKAACVANVKRITRMTRVDRFERKAQGVYIADDKATLSSRTTTEIVLTNAPAQRALLSRRTKTGPAIEEAELYNFNKLEITHEDDTDLKIGFRKADVKKGEEIKYILNETDLTSRYFADFDVNLPELTTKGYVAVCSTLASGSFIKNESDRKVKSTIVLTETFQLDTIAMNSLLKRYRSRK